MESARAGSVEDQLALGMDYLHGEQVDYQEAAYWLEQASRNGSQVAQFQLALLAANGKGVRKDLAKAAEHLEQCQSGGEFEQIAATYKKELDELKALLSAASDDQSQVKRLFHFRSPAMLRRLKEMTRKDKRIFDKAWIWAMFIHLSTAALVLEIALSAPPLAAPHHTIQIEIGGIEQPPPAAPEAPPVIPLVSAPVHAIAPQRTNQTSVLPSALSDATHSAAARPDVAGAGGSKGGPGAQPDLNAFKATDLWNGQSAFDGILQGWGAGEGVGSATGNGLWDSGSGLGKGAAVLCKDLFAKHDVVIVIDKSGSMGTADCPDGRTRWEWCREQTADLAKVAEKFGGSTGPTVTVFSDTFTTYKNARLESVADIFRSNEPQGGTQTAVALKNHLDEYFWTRDKPLVIAVITDGVPNDPRGVRDAIIHATQQIRNANDIKITFLTIGEDPIGYHFASYLDNNLVADGARYDIVYSKPFSQVKHSGIVGALLEIVAGEKKEEAAAPAH
jgi:hypothetical protein